jgi:2-dehydropantoate 2-reductase
MRVLILGAGALGSLVGARLSQTDVDLLLLGRNRPHMEAIREVGLVVEELDSTLGHLNLPACFCDPRDIERPVDLVLVTVKTYDTSAAVRDVSPCCHSGTWFLTLQNGIGNFERIAAEVDSGLVMVGTTAQGATLVAPGRIRHGGNGPTYLGEFPRGVSTRIDSVVDLFRRAGLDAHASDRMETLVWEKLLVNVGINAITALTGIRNGVIADSEAARELSREAVEEALQVTRWKGIAVREDIVERVVEVARATARNRSSMGQDVDRRKRTEIEAINGAIVRYGGEAGLDLPVNRTLTRLVKTIEDGYRREVS